ncbi:MAG TPA: hypothetical protein VMW38_10210 [Terriglobia bacterium]|nr:hypothetical protein [Terriglobia bacterium]
MCRKIAGFSAFSVLLAILAVGWTQTSLKAAASKTLKVKLNYTGSGPLDEKHKIHVLLFDSDPYNSTTFEPMVSKTAGTKNETVIFTDLHTSPVYAIAFYDKYASGQPESGSPVGIYGDGPGKMAPIKLEEEKTVEIEIAFDDSTKVP